MLVDPSAGKMSSVASVSPARGGYRRDGKTMQSPGRAASSGAPERDARYGALDKKAAATVMLRNPEQTVVDSLPSSHVAGKRSGDQGMPPVGITRRRRRSALQSELLTIAQDAGVSRKEAQSAMVEFEQRGVKGAWLQYDAQGYVTCNMDTWKWFAEFVEQWQPTQSKPPSPRVTRSKAPAKLGWAGKALTSGVTEVDERGKTQARVPPVQTKRPLSQGSTSMISDPKKTCGEIRDRLNRSQQMLANLHDAERRANTEPIREPAEYAERRSALISQLEKQTQQDREELQRVEKQRPREVEREELLRTVKQFTSNGGGQKTQSKSPLHSQSHSSTRRGTVVDRLLNTSQTELKTVDTNLVSRVQTVPPVTVPTELSTSDHDVSHGTISSICFNPSASEDEEKEHDGQFRREGYADRLAVLLDEADNGVEAWENRPRTEVATYRMVKGMMTAEFSAQCRVVGPKALEYLDKIAAAILSQFLDTRFCSLEEKEIVSDVWENLRRTQKERLLREREETESETRGSTHGDRDAQRSVNGNRYQEPMYAAEGLTSQSVGNQSATGARGASVKTDEDAQGGPLRTREPERQEDSPVRPGAGAAGSNPAQALSVPIDGIVLDREETRVKGKFQAPLSDPMSGRSSTPRDADGRRPGKVTGEPHGSLGGSNWWTPPGTESKGMQTDPVQLEYELAQVREELTQQLSAVKRDKARSLSAMAKQFEERQTVIKTQCHREKEQLRTQLAEMQSEHEMELSRRQSEHELELLRKQQEAQELEQTAKIAAHERYERSLATVKESAQRTQQALRSEMDADRRASDRERQLLRDELDSLRESSQREKRALLDEIDMLKAAAMVSERQPRRFETQNEPCYAGRNPALDEDHFRETGYQYHSVDNVYDRYGAGGRQVTPRDYGHDSRNDGLSQSRMSVHKLTYSDVVRTISVFRDQSAYQSWDNYWAKFEMTLENSVVPKEEWGQLLYLKIEGPASAHLQGLTPGERKNYLVIVEQLDAIYNADRVREAAENKLDDRKQLESETLEEFVTALKKMAYTAYPNQPERQRAEIVRRMRRGICEQLQSHLISYTYTHPKCSVSELLNYLALHEKPVSETQIMQVYSDESDESLNLNLDEMRGVLRDLMSGDMSPEDAECFLSLTEQRKNAPGGKPFQKPPQKQNTSWGKNKDGVRDFRGSGKPAITWSPGANKQGSAGASGGRVLSNNLFRRVLKMVNAWEAMQKSSGGSGAASLRKPVQATQAPKDGTVCFKCGQPGHWQKDCPEKNTGN